MDDAANNLGFLQRSFEEQVAKRPDALAVKSNHTSLTYQDLSLPERLAQLLAQGKVTVALMQSKYKALLTWFLHKKYSLFSKKIESIYAIAR